MNAEVLIVSFGTLPGARVWLEETCAPFHLLLDPEREVYEAYGLEKSLLRSWNLRTIGHYVRLLTSGRQWRGIQGDSSQLGGDFVIDQKGNVRLAYRSHDPTDRPAATDLLELLRNLDGKGDMGSSSTCSPLQKGVVRRE